MNSPRVRVATVYIGPRWFKLGAIPESQVKLSAQEPSQNWKILIFKIRKTFKIQLKTFK